MLLGRELADIMYEFTAEEWVNTNKLLLKGFCGVKTGVTEAAGPCLASCYIDKNIRVVIVILGCRGYHVRWPETQYLLE